MNEQHHRKIIYHSPPSELIEQLVHQVCRRLSEKEGKHCYSTEVINDFMSFVKTITRIKVKQLNKEHEQE